MILHPSTLDIKARYKLIIGSVLPRPIAAFDAPAEAVRLSSIVTADQHKESCRTQHQGTCWCLPLQSCRARKHWAVSPSSSYGSTWISTPSSIHPWCSLHSHFPFRQTNHHFFPTSLLHHSLSSSSSHFSLTWVA